MGVCVCVNVPECVCEKVNRKRESVCVCVCSATGRSREGLDFSELLGFPGLNAHFVRLTLDLTVKLGACFGTVEQACGHFCGEFSGHFVKCCRPVAASSTFCVFVYLFVLCHHGTTVRGGSVRGGIPSPHKG